MTEQLTLEDINDLLRNIDFTKLSSSNKKALIDELLSIRYAIRYYEHEACKDHPLINGKSNKVKFDEGVPNDYELVSKEQDTYNINVKDSTRLSTFFSKVNEELNEILQTCIDKTENNDQRYSQQHSPDRMCIAYANTIKVADTCRRKSTMSKISNLLSSNYNVLDNISFSKIIESMDSIVFGLIDNITDTLSISLDFIRDKFEDCLEALSSEEAPTDIFYKSHAIELQKLFNEITNNYSKVVCKGFYEKVWDYLPYYGRSLLVNGYTMLDLKSIVTPERAITICLFGEYIIRKIFIEGYLKFVNYDPELVNVSNLNTYKAGRFTIRDFFYLKGVNSKDSRPSQKNRDKLERIKHTYLLFAKELYGLQDDKEASDRLERHSEIISAIQKLRNTLSHPDELNETDIEKLVDEARTLYTNDFVKLLDECINGGQYYKHYILE